MHSEDRDPARALALWWQEHSELDDLVDRMKTAIAQSSAAASAALEELSEALDTHFAVEEEVYLALVRELCPDLAPRVSLARQAHELVRRELDRMRTCLADGDCASARAIFVGALATFGTHERLEGDLIRELSVRAPRG